MQSGHTDKPSGKIWGMYADIYKVRAGKPETLHKAQTTINHGFSTLLPALPPDLSLVISCTYSPKTTTKAKHTKRSSSEINHGSQSGYFWGWCSGFFFSGGTKSDRNTPNKTPQSTMDLSVHSPHTKDVLLKGELLKGKENFISDVEGTRFGRRAGLGDWDRAGNVCCFWRKVKFSECVPSPPSEPKMIIVGVWV